MKDNLFDPEEPLGKVTARIPERYIARLRKEGEGLGHSLSYMAAMAIADAIFHWDREDQEEAEAKEAIERERRKQKGYEKRSLRRYGLDLDDD